MSVFAEVRVPTSAFHLGPVLRKYSDVTVEFARVVPTGGGVQYVWVEGDDRERFVDGLGTNGHLTDVTAVDELPTRTLVRFASRPVEMPFFDLVDERDVHLTSLEGDSDGWSVHLRFPDPDGVREFFTTCRERGIEVTLQRVYDASDQFEDGHGLTRTQEETLELAFASGYFDVPRKVTLGDLSERLGVSEQAVSERLRRGLTSLLTTTMVDEPEGEAESDD